MPEVNFKKGDRLEIWSRLNDSGKAEMKGFVVVEEHDKENQMITLAGGEKLELAPGDYLVLGKRV